MLAALGYDPDTSAKRLGDGLYEQTLVDQAIVARTGARFIDGQTSDTAQFKYLMDNGIAAQQQLNLSVGTALSSEQVAALTHDIVWMQSEVVDGQTVLVPVLYLANANNRLAANGALIQGTDVNLIAGSDLSNAGTLKATGSLSAIAGNNLVNSGVVQADSRLDLLAGNNLTNTAGGIIAGRDVSLTAVDGDVSNERSITTHQSALGSATERTDLVDSAARVEAAGSLSINAGRDVNNTGGLLSSGTGTTITAGRDVNIVAAQAVDASTRTSKFTRSTTTQDSASVTAGGDLSITAGRDLAVTASQLAGGGNVALSATDNVSVSSAADEAHSYTASSHKKWQNDDVTQVASTVTAGGSVAVGAGQDLTLTSSNVTAGTDAYLYAGDKLQMLAAQDSSYSLYDMKKKGSFGSKKLQHDEVTQTTNVGSSVTTGGNLILASNGDQLYQAAKLNSGNDLTVASGGAITFEGVKDLDQETHTKSSSNLAWTSAKGKGNTDETLQQTEMVARGKTVITAVNGLNIDVKQIDKQTVSQVIDTMVAADPKLAWLKDAEARGDVNWQQVKEVHDSFKYSSHGLGAGAEIILAIAMTLAMGPAGLGMGTVSAAGAGSLATTAVNSGISNNGDLGKVLKDTVSASSLKSAGVAMLTAGVGEELQFDPEVLSTNTILKATETAVADAAITTAIEGGSFSKNLVGSLAGQAINVGGAYGANEIGSTAFANGSLTKIGMHALLGGVLSMAQGSDFATGALAAGADEASVQALAKLVMPSQDEATPLTVAQGDQKMIALSGFIGVLAAAVTGGDPSVGASVAQNVTQNNYLGNASKDKRKLGDVDQMVTDLVACRANPDPASCRGTVQSKYQAISDQDTGVALKHCGDNCGTIAQDANTGTDALDRWAASTALTPEELDIIDHFQTKNESDYRLADSTALQGEMAQIVAGVLSGGAGGWAEAEAKAGVAEVAGAKGISPVVTAEGKIGDAAFTDVNQTARPVAQANPDEPTLIADRVTAKTEATGKSLPNGNMADAHAEIGVIQQAYNAGKTQGADMTMSVAGKDVCGFCKGDIAAAAEKSGLSSLTIQAIDDVTGLPKKYNWVPGMRSIKEVP